MRFLSLPRSRAGVGTLALALTAGALSPALALAPAQGQVPAAAVAAKKARSTTVKHTSFDTTAQLRKGTVRGTVVKNGSVTLKSPKTYKRIDGQRYLAGAWVSPWVETSFTELLPSWQASTPGHSLVEVLVRVRDADGTTGSWDRVARWTSQDKGTLRKKPVYARKSWSSQPDDLASVATDTVRVKSAAGAAAWQVKVVLLRRAGSKPTLHRVGAAATTVVPRTTTSAPGTGAGTVIDVPRLSQMTHAGHYPQFGNGGEAWCSPTSLAMVLQHHGVTPAAGHTWAGTKHADGIVDHTASKVYDHRYRGTGNWAFNTAYAGTLLPRTYITRLPHLQAAEKFITAGTPLIVSVAFRRGELTGAPISSTAGHLMVLVGFTADGDVVVNDPAAKKNSQVRRRYDRAEFERAWLNGSGGLTYVLED